VVNPVTNRLYIANGRETLVLEDTVVDMMPTVPVAAGAPVAITSTQVTITFAGVTTAGITQIAPVAAADLNAAVPGGFVIDGALAFNVTTTATVVAPITLCFTAWHVDDAGAFAALRVLHGESGALVDRTSSHDFATRTICATVGSLSPFVIARYTEPTYPSSGSTTAPSHTRPAARCLFD